ncbi:MAG: hypothetical protein AB8H79_01795 [Myxococcota bacterium]
MASDGYHMSLNLSRELWQELLASALPVEVRKGEFDITRNVRTAVKQLGVRQRVAGLLEDRQPPAALMRVKDRAKLEWHKRKGSLYRRVNDMVRVEGTWKVELDDLGTELKYGTQKVTADAFVKGVAQGTVFLLNENVELPFTIERRLGASVTLKDVHYSQGDSAVIGSLGDLAVHIGDNAALQLVARLAEYLLEQQLPRVNPVPILKRSQVEDLVSPAGGALKTKMGVEDLVLQIDEEDMTLKVRFGFSQLQLTERSA